MQSPESTWSFSKRLAKGLVFTWSALREIYYGIKTNRIPSHIWCAPGLLIGLGVVFHWDENILQFVRSSFEGVFGTSVLSHIHLIPALHVTAHIERKIRHGLAYCLILSGWLLWGFYRTYQKNQLLERMTSAFEAAKLRCNGRYPSFIEDIEIDEHTRRLRLRTHGVTKSEFTAATERLETMMNVTIVRFLQEEDKGLLDIVYTTQDLPRIAYLENPERFDNCKVPIGICREGDFVADLRHIGHILVAGQTGGGKSNSLKVMTSILAQNNQDSEIYFLDFKGGMESADLKNTVGSHFGNVIYLEGTTECAKQLGSFGGELETRLKTLTQAGATSLEDYHQRRLDLKNPNVLLAEDVSRTDPRVPALKRVFIVIDEAAQLYAREPGIDRNLVTDARAAVNRIARQGRAAGVHLIIATQKPDNTCFDPTVKANLPAILCFPMANQSSSVSAVGSKRAYELNPDIKGRAIWRFGPQVEEIQTYLFT